MNGSGAPHEAVDQVRADYDAAPYDSHAYPQSAPGHLAAIAYLFGLGTPEVSSARVLEIGCAAGGNLIPFAAGHPRARAVGIDLSQVHIDQGRERVQALGLDNLELLTGDIARMDLAALGQFDFIICHGVYSWVPDEVQGAILSAIGRGASTFNLWHEMLPLSPVDGYLLSMLDGSRDRDALVEALLAIARRDVIRFERDGERVSGDAELRTTLAEHIDAMPQRLAQIKLVRTSDAAR